MRCMQRTQVLFLKTGSWEIALALFALATLLFGLAPAQAQEIQIQQVGLPGEQLAINLSPSVPGPNETVTAKAESFSTDLNRATLSWYVNGKLVAQGLGEKEIEFTTGDIGKTTTVTLSASLSSGQQIQKTLSLVPADVDLILEARSYTHPFYKGRSLPPPNAPITLVAVPHFKSTGGQRLSDRNLIYTWRDGVTVLGNLSGTGRN